MAARGSEHNQFVTSIDNHAVRHIAICSSEICRVNQQPAIGGKLADCTIPYPSETVAERSRTCRIAYSYDNGTGIKVSVCIVCRSKAPVVRNRTGISRKNQRRVYYQISFTVIRSELVTYSLSLSFKCCFDLPFFFPIKLIGIRLSLRQLSDRELQVQLPADYLNLIDTFVKQFQILRICPFMKHELMLESTVLAINPPIHPIVNVLVNKHGISRNITLPFRFFVSYEVIAVSLHSFRCLRIASPHSDRLQKKSMLHIKQRIVLFCFMAVQMRRRIHEQQAVLSCKDEPVAHSRHI